MKMRNVTVFVRRGSYISYLNTLATQVCLSSEHSMEHAEKAFQVAVSQAACRAVCGLLELLQLHLQPGSWAP